MEYQIPKEEAQEIVNNIKELDVECGYDANGSLHILCGIDDEQKITDIVDSMGLPYRDFMWFGSFASDAIIEELN